MKWLSPRQCTERKQRGNLLALKILDSFFFFPNESENLPWSVLGKA